MNQIPFLYMNNSQNGIEMHLSGRNNRYESGNKTNDR